MAQVVPEYDEMGGSHVVVLLELIGGHDGGHILGQGPVQLVVDRGVALGVHRRDEEQGEEGHEGLAVADHKVVDPAEIQVQGGVAVFGDAPVQHQQDGWQHQHHGGHPKHHALGHHKADVPPQQQPHEAQRPKAGDGGQGAPRQGGKGGHDGFRHGVPVVLVIGPLLLIAVVEEDGIVHGHPQLKDSGDGLGDVGDLAEEEIGAEVVEDGHADAQEEGHRQQPGFHREGHGHEGEGHRQQDVEGQLLVYQLLGVFDEDGEAGQEAPLVAQPAHLADGLHGLL